MADKKISELNSADLPLSGNEQLAIVQSGETKKVSASDIGGEESLWERSTGANSLVPKDSGSVASGDNAISEGFNTQAKAPYSRTGGRSTIVEVDAEGGIAEGEDTITRGKGARSGGIESEANGDSSVADGDNVIAQSYGETVVGTYNKLDASFNPNVSVPEDKAFSVGVGQFGDEKNGLVVRKNGVITADELTQAQYDDEPTGKVLVTKEVLENNTESLFGIRETSDPKIVKSPIAVDVVPEKEYLVGKNKNGADIIMQQIVFQIASSSTGTENIIKVLKNRNGDDIQSMQVIKTELANCAIINGAGARYFDSLQTLNSVTGADQTLMQLSANNTNTEILFGIFSASLEGDLEVVFNIYYKDAVV